MLLARLTTTQAAVSHRSGLFLYLPTHGALTAVGVFTPRVPNSCFLGPLPQTVLSHQSGASSIVLFFSAKPVWLRNRRILLARLTTKQAAVSHQSGLFLCLPTHGALTTVRVFTPRVTNSRFLGAVTSRRTITFYRRTGQAGKGKRP